MKKLLITIIVCFIIFNIFKIINYFYITNKTEENFNNIADSIHIKNNTIISQDNKEVIKNKEIENVNNLINQNENMFGWIYIEDTNIDYPVMQSEEYLYKDFNENNVPGDSGFASIPQLIFVCEDERHMAECFKEMVTNKLEIPQITFLFTTDLRQNEETLTNTLVEFKLVDGKYKMENVELKLIG